MEAPLIGQAALVTGGGQGIGRAIGLRLAAEQMHIAVVDRDGEWAEAVAAEIRAIGGQALAITADVTAVPDRERMFAATLAAFGRLDVLVNNAGILRTGDPLAVTEEHWDVVMDVNARATYFCCQHALRHMIAQRSGRVVNIASAAGKSATTIHHPIYNISKAAVIAMTRTLAHAAAPAGVRINAVCPGMIDTPMQDAVDTAFAELRGVLPAAIRAERVARIPLGHSASPAAVAEVVVFLIGPGAYYMTGQAINVTGGMIMY
ncbi:MAG TPA: SDR family NAD(P)-dependent oxidoreductase [Roseiflexaceae bacterium]|nr:SDR family NAD(P)-dependent oxidoreductase [Roseiflexaceae bacterium]